MWRATAAWGRRGQLGRDRGERAVGHGDQEQVLAGRLELPEPDRRRAARRSRPAAPAARAASRAPGHGPARQARADPARPHQGEARGRQRGAVGHCATIAARSEAGKARAALRKVSATRSDAVLLKCFGSIT